MKTWNQRLKDALAESEEYQGNANRFAGDLGVSAPTVAAWIAAGNIKPAQDIRAAHLINACGRLHVTPEWILFGRAPKNASGIVVNPDANVTGSNSEAVIPVLIKRLQSIHKEVQEILAVAQGLPVESIPPESPHDMSIASVIHDVEATKGLAGGIRQEGKEHGHGRSRQSRKRSGKT
ncbi:hypothetical protein ACFSHT_22265 [Paraburkholderia silviterrae]|uniref:Uncharacterized protein n=1 Tax=Paraburkholderia silviterrae TaxID=2528715 RepID=A0A4R5MFB2_9BURK|nr:hypothetical protein [Paraburkholderia silviterrae]TDG25892.1 hypothetical protein EYW47_00535 [Paraburkholderia silviterrae]